MQINQKVVDMIEEIDKMSLSELLAVWKDSPIGDQKTKGIVGKFLKLKLDSMLFKGIVCDSVGEDVSLSDIQYTIVSLCSSSD